MVAFVRFATCLGLSLLLCFSCVPVIHQYMMIMPIRFVCSDLIDFCSRLTGPVKDEPLAGAF